MFPHTCAYSYTHTHILSLSLSLSLCVTHTLSLSLCHTHTRSLSHASSSKGKGMLSSYTGLIVAICSQYGSCGDNGLLTSAVLALCKFMCCSAEFCETHLQLLFSVKSSERVCVCHFLCSFCLLSFSAGEKSRTISFILISSLFLCTSFFLHVCLHVCLHVYLRCLSPS